MKHSRMSNCSNPINESLWYEDPTLNVIWRFQIVWEQVSLILGIFGNAFVLYATIAHSAIKLDKMSVWIIKNLAAADICSCVLVLLPILLTQYGKLNGTLIFGETFYVIMGCYFYTFYVANLIFVNFLSFNKLMRCMFPLRNLDSTRRQRIAVTMCTILISSVPTIWTVCGFLDELFVISDRWESIRYLGAVDIGYSYIQFNERKIGYGTRRIVNNTIIIICSCLPCLSLVALNSALVVFAVKKSLSAINKRNLLTVILVTATFLISVMPYTLEFFLVRSAIHGEIAWCLTCLPIWINPFIYVAVNPCFKEFVKTKLLSCKQSFSVQPL